METLVVIAMLVLSLFGPGWSSGHKAFWEWQLGRPLEGWEEHRLSRGERLDGGGCLVPDAQPNRVVESSSDHETGFIPATPQLCNIMCIIGPEGEQCYLVCHSP